MKLILTILLLSIIGFCYGQEENLVTSSDGLLHAGYYTFRKTNFVCVVAPCPTHYVQKVNTQEPEVEIIGFSFFMPGLNKSHILEAEDNTVLVYGLFLRSLEYPSYFQFYVIDYNKALPIDRPASGKYYVLGSSGIMCIRSPCPSLTVTELNTGVLSLVTGWTEPYTQGIHLFDDMWLFSRLFNGASHGVDNTLPRQAVIRGSIVIGGADIGTRIIGTQVLVDLPDPAPYQCPPVIPSACNKMAGQTPVYTRDSNRCFVADGCVEAGVCIKSIPVCPSGYRLASVVSRPHACPMYYCDADFLTHKSHTRF
eukprot:gene1118-1423_t